MAGCVTLNKAEHIESMRKIEETWNKDKTLVEQFGCYKTICRGEINLAEIVQGRGHFGERTGSAPGVIN